VKKIVKIDPVDAEIIGQRNYFRKYKKRKRINASMLSGLN